MTYIFIVIPLYCLDIKPVFTQCMLAFRKWNKRHAENSDAIIVYDDFCFIDLLSLPTHLFALQLWSQDSTIFWPFFPLSAGVTNITTCMLLKISLQFVFNQYLGLKVKVTQDPVFSSSFFSFPLKPTYIIHISEVLH